MGRRQDLEIPKAFIDQNTTAMDELIKMLEKCPELYDKCISTPGFAYGFSQLANRAIHFDWLKAKGIIPRNYPEQGALGDAPPRAEEEK